MIKLLLTVISLEFSTQSVLSILIKIILIVTDLSECRRHHFSVAVTASLSGVAQHLIVQSFGPFKSIVSIVEHKAYQLIVVTIEIAFPELIELSDSVADSWSSDVCDTEVKVGRTVFASRDLVSESHTWPAIVDLSVGAVDLIVETSVSDECRSHLGTFICLKDKRID